jgi:hypothetical protein
VSISSIAANAIYNTPTATSGVQSSFPTASANGGAATPSAATGSSDPFLGLSAALQSMLVQLQGGATTQGTASATSTNGAANLSQNLAADMRQALQAYAGSATPTPTF